jgi:hypothetical protein
VLQAAFSKKPPKDAPEIPDYDTFVLRYNKKKNNVSDDENAEMFRTDAWWKKPNKNAVRHAEVKAGGNKALNHELPEVMNVNPDIDEETESMMQQFFYGEHDEGDTEIE